MPHPESVSPWWDEGQRLAVLDSYGILDTPREPVFDGIVRLIAAIFDAPMAAISLVDAARQWFKAEVGLGLRELSLDASICTQSFMAGRLVVEDLAADERFAAHPLVVGQPHLRFYAGEALTTSTGLPLGSLCVLDTRPRPEGITPLQAQALRELADQVMMQIDLRLALRRRIESEDMARRALAASNYVGAWEWDILADRVVADERFAVMFGVDRSLGHIGAPLSAFLQYLHPDDVEPVNAAIAEAMQSQGSFHCEYRIQVPGEPVRWLQARGQVYFNAEGQATRFPGVVVDITSRRQSTEALAEAALKLTESEAQFRVLADAMPQMVWSCRADGHHDYFNARWYEFCGVPVGSTDGLLWSEMVHPDDRERAKAMWQWSLDSGTPYEIEYRLKHHSGNYRWLLGRATALKDENNGVLRWFGTGTDIDELKRLEQSRELVSQELSHRIKNIFAVVSALTALSARQYPEGRAFATALRTRITALARAHEFVRPHTESSQTSAGLTTLHAFLDDLFAAYAGGEGNVVSVTGDDAVFDDQAATSVALLFHELATNAAKYGALSANGGRIRLDTRREADRYILTWIEEGGPPVSGPPVHAGFGSSLVTLSVEGQMGGRLTQEWLPSGLKVVIDLPAVALSRRRFTSI